MTYGCHTIFEHIIMSFKNFICIYVSFKIKRHNITHVISWFDDFMTTGLNHIRLGVCCHTDLCRMVLCACLGVCASTMRTTYNMCSRVCRFLPFVCNHVTYSDVSCMPACKLHKHRHAQVQAAKVHVLRLPTWQRPGSCLGAAALAVLQPVPWKMRFEMVKRNANRNPEWGGDFSQLVTIEIRDSLSSVMVHLQCCAILTSCWGSSYIDSSGMNKNTKSYWAWLICKIDCNICMIDLSLMSHHSFIIANDDECFDWLMLLLLLHKKEFSSFDASSICSLFKFLQKSVRRERTRPCGWGFSNK